MFVQPSARQYNPPQQLTSIMAEGGHTDSLGHGIDVGAGNVGVILAESVGHREAWNRPRASSDHHLFPSRFLKNRILI
jgi:hypothetical protein